MQHNDLGRTGLNPNETILSPANVDVAHFGKKFAQAVDGWIFAQPLVVPQVAIPNMGTHDVVYVATENNSVYAFDATTIQPALWHASFLSAGVTPVPAPDTNESTITPEVGITGTPVIDVASSTLYVVSETKTTAGPSYAYHLHALDLATGAEKLGGPVVVTGGVPGQAPDAVGGMVGLDPLHGGQRAGLALSGGVLYIPFAGHGDRYQYWHGWVFGYDATTLAQKFVYCSTPDANEGAIWQSGAGVAIDAAGNAYAETANGSIDGMNGGRDLSMSVVKVSSAGKLVDWFAPHDAVALSNADVDLGSAGPMLLPDQTGAHPHLLIGGGKPGYIYLLDRDRMGHFNAADDSQIVQKLSVHPNSTSDSAGIFATPVYFNGRVYASAIGDSIKAFSLTAGTLSTTPVSATTRTFGQAFLSVSSNGSAAGILWMLLADGFTPSHPAVLYAFDASDLAKELWDSTQAPAMRDAAGTSSKFLVPTVANGHVYVGTQTELDVYGEL
jgi:outer membrane protein assembly factor BamB